MEFLSREFTRTEKILIIFLSVLLMALMYYRFLYRPVKQEIEQCNAQRDAMRMELTQVQNRLSQLKRMREELDRLGRIGYTSRMPSYNSSEIEISFLNDVLANADQFSISFSNVTRNNDQIRRNFSLRFTTSSYRDAEEILTELTTGENRCLLGDMRLSSSTDGAASVNVTATFFETLVGGTPDKGLPSQTDR